MFMNKRLVEVRVGVIPRRMPEVAAILAGSEEPYNLVNINKTETLKVGVWESKRLCKTRKTTTSIFRMSYSWKMTEDWAWPWGVVCPYVVGFWCGSITRRITPEWCTQKLMWVQQERRRWPPRRLVQPAQQWMSDRLQWYMKISLRQLAMKAMVRLGPREKRRRRKVSDVRRNEAINTGINTGISTNEVTTKLEEPKTEPFLRALQN